jgi:PAS domain-containing protein
MVVFRRAASRRIRELEQEVAIRHAAEEHLEILLNSSPAGIVTVSPEGKIEVCNLAAHQIFRVAPGGLTGLPINSFLPHLDQVDGVKAPKAMECRGRRANGEIFRARIWTSVFPGGAGATAMIVVDASEDVDDGGTKEP